MRKHIQLNIPQPCHENWDSMEPAEKGKFCGSCQKEVIDFATMSDVQLVSFFKKPSNGSVCGRFMENQLDRSIDIPKKRIPWVKYFFQFALPAFLISSKAVAQGTVTTIAGDTIMVPKPKIETGKGKPVRLGRRIGGTVIDDNGQGISYASVFIKGTTIGVATDSVGSFTLKYTGTEDSIVLVSSSVGFQNTESMVRFTKNEETILISLNAMNTLGEVLVISYGKTMGKMIFAGGVSVSRNINIIDTICNAVLPKKKALKLYPNPIKRNNLLTIEMKKHETGTYLLQLAAANGQVVLSKEKWMDKNDRVIQIDIPSIAAGVYFVNMINKRSGKNNAGKIIVE